MENDKYSLEDILINNIGILGISFFLFLFWVSSLLLAQSLPGIIGFPLHLFSLILFVYYVDTRIREGYAFFLSVILIGSLYFIDKYLTNIQFLDDILSILF